MLGRTSDLQNQPGQFYIQSLTLSWRYHIETSPLICCGNKWTGFCMIGTSVMKKVKACGRSPLEENNVKRTYTDGSKRHTFKKLQSNWKSTTDVSQILPSHLQLLVDFYQPKQKLSYCQVKGINLSYIAVRVDF